MSVVVDLESLDPTSKNVLVRMCTIRSKATTYDPDPRPVLFYKEEDGAITLPIFLWKKLFDEFPEDEYEKIDVGCKKTLFTIKTDPKHFRDQDVVFEKALGLLKENHSVFLALSTGFGKTTLGNYFCCHLGLKTLVLCHLSTVNRQWVEEFEKFSDAKVQLVKDRMDPDADVYVMGIQKSMNVPEGDFRGIGLVIVDEAHIATITAFSESLLRIQPKYLVALSATPDRLDGMDSAYSLFFGKKEDFIVREERKNFVVYKVETPFKPEIRYTVVRGKTVPDWTHVINTISENEERHKLIAKIAIDLPEEKFMILGNRDSQSIAVHKILQERNEDSHLFIKQEKYRDCRILVAGMKKAGVGFNDPKLTALILATDCTQVQQYEGRIRTTDNVIYDLVDNYGPFENHWKEREEWYLKRGATIKVISLRSKETAQRRRLAPNK